MARTWDPSTDADRGTTPCSAVVNRETIPGIRRDEIESGRQSPVSLRLVADACRGARRSSGDPTRGTQQADCATLASCALLLMNPEHPIQGRSAGLPPRRSLIDEERIKKRRCDESPFGLRAAACLRTEGLDITVARAHTHDRMRVLTRSTMKTTNGVSVLRSSAIDKQTVSDVYHAVTSRCRSSGRGGSNGKGE